MRQITEQQIQAIAPNPTAVANGRKISQKGGFVRLEKSADDTFYLGECTGSGKSNYITSVDYIVPEAPVYRCSCPSRQFPCKHSLALMYEMLAQKSFTVCDIPEDILKKREKIQAKEAKRKGTENSTETTDDGKTAKHKETSKRAGKAARTKKLKKQLEGIDMTDKLVKELVRAGLGTMGGTALDTYRQLAKQLGDYFLPGPQRLLNSLILEIEAFQQDSDEKHYEAAVDVLEKLWALVKKSRQYLTEKLEKDEVEQDDILYEKLGGVWKLAELEALGRSKKNVSFAQLAFWIEYDEARKEYIDTGCWADLDTGEIYMTYNYRPIKAVKYVKQEDTIFGVAEVPCAVYYPGERNVRIRWETANIRPVREEDCQRMRTKAVSSLPAEAKAAKNLLKNPMAAPLLYRLVAFERIGKTEQGVVLQTEGKDTILLGNAPGMEHTLDRLCMLPDKELLENQVLLGAFYYDRETRRLKLQPLSIVTQTDIVRLLY